jgi:hypothetical protein
MKKLNLNKIKLSKNFKIKKNLFVKETKTNKIYNKTLNFRMIPLPKVINNLKVKILMK